jgi:AraC-like DNA-binding protein
MTHSSHHFVIPVPAWPAADSARRYRTCLFTGTRLRLDEHRWSPSLAAELSIGSSGMPLLIVMDGGRAMVCDRDAPPPIAHRDDWTLARHVTSSADESHATGVWAVFQFQAGAIASAPALAADAAAPSSASAARARRRLVQLSPNALFRYYWRRHALALRHPAPEQHVEEDALALLRHVVSRTWPHGRTRLADDSPGQARHHTLARDAQALMAVTIADPHPVAQIAQRLGTSPFHLARVFRTEVGLSLHQYLMELRLAEALDRLRTGAPDLSKLALDLGFSHHSHFSAAFRQMIGYSPRDVRRMLTADSVADLGIASRRCS